MHRHLSLCCIWKWCERGLVQWGWEQSLRVPVLPGNTLITYLAAEQLNPFSYQRSAGKEISFPEFCVTGLLNKYVLKFVMLKKKKVLCFSVSFQRQNESRVKPEMLNTCMVK